MAKKLTEKQIDKLYVVVCGGTLVDGSRLEKGTDDKPNFVEEKNFSKKEWKALLDMKMVVPFEKPETEEEKEQIVLEVIE